MSRRPIIVVALLACAIASAPALGSFRAAPAVKRSVLVAAPAVGANGRVLGLESVTIPAGIRLPKHRHPGTQVATILKGTLEYHVYAGTVPVYRVDATGNPALVRTLHAGQTGVIHAGQSLVEQPNDIHSSGNPGKVPIVVLIATLFGPGAPLSIPVK